MSAKSYSYDQNNRVLNKIIIVIIIIKRERFLTRAERKQQRVYRTCCKNKTKKIKTPLFSRGRRYMFWKTDDRASRRFVFSRRSKVCGYRCFTVHGRTVLTFAKTVRCLSHLTEYFLCVSRTVSRVFNVSTFGCLRDEFDDFTYRVSDKYYDGNVITRDYKLHDEVVESLA